MQVHDNAELGAWVHHVRKLHKLGKLQDEQRHELSTLGFVFTVDAVTSKWHYCFHEARRYKVTSLSCTVFLCHTHSAALEFENTCMFQTWLPA